MNNGINEQNILTIKPYGDGTFDKVKVVFDFEGYIDMHIKNWELLMPLSAIPRVGETISTGILMKKDGIPYNSDSMWCKIEEVVWVFRDGHFCHIWLTLSEVF